MRVISLCNSQWLLYMYRQCFESLMKFQWPLYSDIIFFVDLYSAGVSNKHCLLPFLIGIVPLRKTLCILQWFLKAVKMIRFI